MKHGQLRSVLWPIGRMIGLPSTSDLTDGQLLQRFATRHEEAAFESLLQRHGPMVLGVCRRVLNHPQAAEDAFQATFLLLVRKAGTIAKQESVGSWLYGAAFRIAAKARASTDRRRAHERQVVDMRGVDPRCEPVWQALEPVIDEEVNRLPKKYRQPVVLCYLQGKAYAEAARQLGCPTGTVSVRLTRARALLRRRLARRGVVLSVGLLSALLMEHVSEGFGGARALDSESRSVARGRHEGG